MAPRVPQMTPYISGFASVPKSLLTEGQIAKLKKMATVIPKAFQPGEEKEPINGWRETLSYLHLPVVRGMRMLKEMGFAHVFKNKTALGHPITVPQLPDPHHPDAPESQEEFMELMLAAVKARYAVIGKAGTGNGKTAVSLWTAAMLGRTTLVVAPGENLAYNWKDEIIKHLGLSEDEIGWVQQDKCDYIGKKVVIAVVHSLAKRVYPPAFYGYFGTVIYDEVHTMGARSFSKTLGKIPARYKIAMSATPTRKDGCEGLFLNYFGADFVEAEDDSAMECTALIVPYNLPFPEDEFPNQSPSIALNILSKLKSRNKLIADWAWKFYQKKRTMVIMSDRIEQLAYLRELLVNLGVPLERIAMYAKQDIINKKRVSIGIKELQKRKKDPTIRIYLATYGVFKQGENIPRLDAGIEATPRADGIQPPGRIRRRRPGKVRPVWVSIADQGSWLLVRRTKARIKEYIKAKIKVSYANSSS